MTNADKNAAIAERVMGWKPDGAHDICFCDDMWYSWCRNCGKSGGQSDDIFNWEPGKPQPTGCTVPSDYLTDANACLLALEKMDSWQCSYNHCENVAPDAVIYNIHVWKGGRKGYAAGTTFCEAAVDAMIRATEPA